MRFLYFLHILKICFLQVFFVFNRININNSVNEPLTKILKIYNNTVKHNNKSNNINEIFKEVMMKMKRFNFWMPTDLYERIKITAKKYGLSMTKMTIKLLEIGYIKFLSFDKPYLDKDENN